MKKYFSYARISTKEIEDKQSFSRQIKAFEQFEKKNNIEFTLQFKDDCSGKNFNRPQWIKLESLLQNGYVIVFKELSRFTREAENGYKKYMELKEKGIKLIFLDNPTVDTEYVNELTKTADSNLVTKTAIEGIIKLLLIVELDRVEKERETLIRRIKQGIQASKKTQGRKKGKVDKMTEELKQSITLYLQDRNITQVGLMKKHKISRNTLKKYIEIVRGGKC